MPKTNTTCDRIIRGDAFPFLPKLRGTISTPGTSPLFQSVSGPLSCQYDLVSGDAQSVVLMIQATQSGKSVPPCRTVCDGTGCKCNSEHSLDRVDHLLLHSPGMYSACICGDYQVSCSSFEGFPHYYPVCLELSPHPCSHHTPAAAALQGHKLSLQRGGQEFEVLCKI